MWILVHEECSKTATLARVAQLLPSGSGHQPCLAEAGLEGVSGWEAPHNNRKVGKGAERAASLRLGVSPGAAAAVRVLLYGPCP